MKYYMAPLEGITGHIYRTTYAKYFGGIDKYFSPFISPNQKKICRTREKKDILPGKQCRFVSGTTDYDKSGGNVFADRRIPSAIWL